MSFLLLKQKIKKILQQPVTKKSLLAFGVVTSLFFTFQNCSETKFAEMQLASQSLSVEELCSLDDMRESSVSMGTNGYFSVPLNPTQMRSVPKGSFAYLWINGFQKIEGADWYVSKDGGMEYALGSGEKVTYPNVPNQASGLSIGNYKIRINLSKICQNLNQNSGTSALSQAQLDASSRIEKNIFVQFNVIDPQTVGCQSLTGVFLNADDPKTINTDVRFSIALPANCSLPVKYNFGDGSPVLEDASTVEKHKYAHSGQYTAQARLGSESTAFKKDLSKNVVILSECPKPQNMFISGPSTLKFGTTGEYELQNYINNSCNLGINKVTFKKDGQSKVADDVEAPFKVLTSWLSSEAKAEPDFNTIVAEVYFNSPEDHGVTNPYIVKKSVYLTESVTGCSAEALASISISGPTSALVNTSLTHLAIVPECMRQPSFTSNNSIEWSLEQISPAASSVPESLGGGYSITKQYSTIGLFVLKAKIKDTKSGEINLHSYVNVLDNMPPVCSVFQYSEWGACQPDGKHSRTLMSSKPIGCTGGNPVLIEDCVYSPPAPVTCTSFTYTEYGACQPDNTKSRSVLTSLPAGCTGGTPVLTEPCTYTPPVCTGFSYSAWGACQSNNKQYRTVTTSTPAGCAGGTPELEQACSYTAPVCTGFSYSAWGACQPNNTQTRTVTSSSPTGCAGGNPVTTQACTYTPPVCSSFTYSAWGACQPNNTQTRTVTSSSPTGCAGGSPVTTQACTYTPPVCSSFTYSSWGACQPDNTQSRTVTSSSPTGCTGGNPVTSQSCTYVPPVVVCSSFTYSSWGACQPDNTQTRSVTSSSPAGCTGGNPVTSQSCTYVPPVVVCSSFTYSAWGACQTNNTQTRSVTSSSPAGCTGGTPVTSQSCTYVPPTCSSFTYSSWGACQPNNTQTRSVTSSSPTGCTGGNPVTSQSCTYVPPTCSSFTYSSWGACQPNNTQTRSVTSSSPSGCTGGNPVTSQSCTYVPPTCSSFTYSSWGACQPNNTQTRSVTSSSPTGCTGGNPVTSQSCTYVPPTCTSFTYSGWGSCQPNNLQYRTTTSSSPSGCSGGSPDLTQSCCYNGATNPGYCTSCPQGQTLSHITGRCEALAANRWCHKVSASGPTLGYQDPGAIHEPGCYHDALKQWYAVGATINYDGHAIRCDSGAASSYPVPDYNCPQSSCGALTSNALCSVTKQCTNGKRLAASQGLVPNTANISGTYLQTVDVGQPQVSDPSKWRIDGWNLNGATLRMTCDNINNQLQWRQSSDGYCNATYFMSQAETDADPNCADPIPSNYERVNCASLSCEWDGQHYDNSLSCCYESYNCGYGGSGTCRLRNGIWYIENFSCGYREYINVQCK